MVGCLNLGEMFGVRYMVTFDDAYDPRHVPHDKLDPWMMQMPCRGGITVYPYGGTALAVEVDHHKHVSMTLRKMGLKVLQDGDNEQTFLFDAEAFDQVAAVVRPHRKRRWTEEDRQEAIERLKEYQFRPEPPASPTDQLASAMRLPSPAAVAVPPVVIRTVPYTSFCPVYERNPPHPNKNQ